jgi:hypothetical protein
MTARELLEWAAYERVYGSILPHERIDVGFAQVSLILTKAFGKPGQRLTLRDFMPEWYRELTADDELAKGMAQLRLMKGAAVADH